MDLCAACKIESKTRTCAKCMVVRYCGKECQTEHWSTHHKKVCPRLTRTYTGKQVEDAFRIILREEDFPGYILRTCQEWCQGQDQHLYPYLVSRLMMPFAAAFHVDFEVASKTKDPDRIMRYIESRKDEGHRELMKREIGEDPTQWEMWEVNPDPIPRLNIDFSFLDTWDDRDKLLAAKIEMCTTMSLLLCYVLPGSRVVIIKPTVRTVNPLITVERHDTGKVCNFFLGCGSETPYHWVVETLDGRIIDPTYTQYDSSKHIKVWPNREQMLQEMQAEVVNVTEFSLPTLTTNLNTSVDAVRQDYEGLQMAKRDLLRGSS